MLALVAAVSLFSTRGAVSQDGSGTDRIAFQSNRDGDWEIFTINADGTGERPVTVNAAEDASPSWGPVAVAGTSQRLAYQSNADGDFEIYVVADDGTGVERLTANSVPDTEPAWSPDGTEIAFVREQRGSTDLYVMNADGTGERRLTNAAGEEASPAWARDGRLAFSRDRGTDSGIYVIGRDGSGERRVTSGAAADADPAWFQFPDGTEMIAFDRLARPGADYEVSLVNAAGGEVRRLSFSDSQDREPVWSPAGGRIAFASDRDGNLELYEMAGDGSGQIRLTVSGGDDTEPDFLRIAKPPVAGPPGAPQGSGTSCRGGGRGANVYVGSARDDRICGGDGDDRIKGLAGRDTLYGDDGRDRLRGGPGPDALNSVDGYGGDVVRGGRGRDTGDWDPGDTARSISRQR